MMRYLELLATEYIPILPLWIVDAFFMLICAVGILVFFSLFAGPVSFLERRIAGRIMSRIGPNRVGPQGIIQWLADGMKCFFKEDLIPASADQILYRIAPYPVFLGVFLTLAALPFSSQLVAADINVGLLYVVGSCGLVIIGILAAGWGSNNKWALLGGMRSAAQMVSYEIPMMISLLCVVISSGSLGLQDIIRSQGAWPTEWFIFQNPFALLAFVVFFISSVAEGNRTPFDIPEAESELVAGYNVEYSGMRFLFFFFAEWGNLYVIGALVASMFLGGWQLPQGLAAWAAAKSWILPHIFEAILFQMKAWIWVLLIIQLRWTLPRLRVDQLMTLAWRYLTPMAFVAFLGEALWLLIFPSGLLIVKLGLVASAASICLYFFWRVIRHLKFTKSKIDINWFI